MKNLFTLLLCICIYACTSTSSQEEAINTLKHQQDSIISLLNKKELTEKQEKLDKENAHRKTKFFGWDYDDVRNKILLGVSAFDLKEGRFDDTHEDWIMVPGYTSEFWYIFKNKKCVKISNKVPVEDASKYIAEFNSKGYITKEGSSLWLDTLADCNWTIKNYLNGKVLVDCNLNKR